MPSIDLINAILKDMIQSCIKNNIKFKTIINDKKAIKLFYSMYHSLNSKTKYQLEIDVLIIEFFEYILKYHTIKNADEAVNISCSKKDLNNALDYMNNIDMKDNLSLDQISSQANISKYHFHKEFKKYLGITPNEYMQIRRVNLVKQMIEKKIPLSHIAYECGFNDQSYMIKIFKKYNGYTPNKLHN